MTSAKGMTRRRFLWTGALAGGALVVGTTGQAGASAAAVPGAAGSVARVRPLVVGRGRGIAAVVQQFPFPPLAYLDSRAGRIYVDRAHRDQVAGLLEARVEPGGRWILAAGTAREEDMRAWDPERVPQVGDCRVVSRAPARVRWEFVRLPVFAAAPAAWLDGDPLEHVQCCGPQSGPQREEYRVVGVRAQYTDPDCTCPAGQAEILNWVAAARSSRGVAVPLA